MKTFPAIIMIAFVILALFGVFVFATFSTSSGNVIGDVVVWGSLPRQTVDKLFSNVRDSRDDFARVTYEFFPENELVPRMVEAIAAGRGPDLVFFPGSATVKDGEKLASISYSTFPRRDFQDTFVEAGEVFLREDGIAALPLVIDPIIMYWNRTLFSNAGVPAAPRYWDEVGAVAQKITQKSSNGSVTIAAVPLGGWGNISYAKEVLVTLMRQLGTSIVSVGPNGNYVADLTKTGSDVQPAVSAMRYYIDFADPVKPVYSWNRSQKLSRDAFLEGSLAIYFAPASELLPLRDANPNLNFDVAPLPVARGAGSAVAARVIGAAVPRGALNPTGAALAAIELTSATQQAFFSDYLALPSTRRDVNPDATADPYQSVFRASALRSFVFLDPNPPESEKLFERLVESVSSGRNTISQAGGDAQDELQVLLKVR